MDTKLKQRLIGGAVLIALAVIFLPMLVQGPAPDSGVGDVSTRVPAAPAGKFETRELPLGPAAGQAALPAPATPAPAEAVEPAAAAPVQTADATADEPAAKPDPAVAAGQWAVSFGAYASERDADAVLSRLHQARLEGFKEAAELNGRKAWRVRVGPYSERAHAEAGRLQAVRIRNDVNAQVIALDAGAGTATVAAGGVPATDKPAAAPAPVPRTGPDKPGSSPSPATTQVAAPPKAPVPAPAAAPKPTPAAVPAAAGLGFAVQMGAFASEAEATALRDRLRAAGHSAIVQPVRTDKGTLNRVRVGPVATRAEAEQLKSRLAGGFGAGMVVQHP